MKILIAYAGRGGATKECADLLAKRLSAHHTPLLCDAKSEPIPSPAEFDVVVLGSAIYFSRAHKTVKRYVKEHRDTLSKMPTAIFLVCGYPKQFDEYADIEFSKKLTCSLGIHSFGGELKPEKRSGLDKLIVRMMRSSILSQDFEESDDDHHPLPELLPENINLLAEKIEKLGKI